MIGRMFLRVHACSGAQRTSVPVALPRHHPLHPVQAAKARLPGAAGVEALHIKPDDRLPHLQCCDLWVGGRGRQAASETVAWESFGWIGQQRSCETSLLQLQPHLPRSSAVVASLPPSAAAAPPAACCWRSRSTSICRRMHSLRAASSSAAAAVYGGVHDANAMARRRLRCGVAAFPLTSTAHSRHLCQQSA